MSHTRHILFSLLCISNALLSIDSTTQNNNQNKQFPLDSKHIDTIPGAIDNEFSEEDIEEMEFIFKSSPIEAREIVDHLQDPTYFIGNKDYRSSFFVGEPGTGKTMMAKAIAYKMAKEKGWEYKFVSSTSFLGEYRNQTAIHLQKELETIEKSKKPTIIIIDELHRLLENTNSKHHDTDSNVTALWTFLDKQKDNENFFLIGTMNRIDKLPKALKSRIVSDFILFPALTDPTIKNNILRRNLITLQSDLDKDITDDFLNKELKKIDPCFGRDLKKISNEIHRINRRNNPMQSSMTIVKKTSIEQAINAHIMRKAILKYETEDETDEERQNRYHQENLNMHEQHFAQQQLMQIAINDHQNNASKNIYANHYELDSRKKIDSLIPDEQKKLYLDMMTNTEARKAREAAEKIAAEEASKKAAEEAASEKAKRDAENSLYNQLARWVKNNDQ